jgi:hypothetical protein
MDALATRLVALNIHENLPGTFESLCCSGYLAYENMQAGVVDLNSAIHPIFRRENFSTYFHYPILEPSLRLASRLLTSRSLVPFINVVIDGWVRNPLG